MERFKSFEELFQKKLGGEEGLISSGEKFLGVFTGDELRKVENFLRTDLGVYRRRAKRPFIGKFEQEDRVYVIVFLTTKGYSKKFIDLRFCNKGKERECRNLELNCFILKDRNRNEVLAYALHEDRFKKFNFLYCGACRDLEDLDRLRREYFR